MFPPPETSLLVCPSFSRAPCNKNLLRKVVCEYPDRARTKGNSGAGPVSWMTEHSPRRDENTTYHTRAEADATASLRQQLRERRTKELGRAKYKTLSQKQQQQQQQRTNAHKHKPKPIGGQKPNQDFVPRQPALSLELGPGKQAIPVPVLSVR